MKDYLKLGDKKLNSRLLTGTGKYSNKEIITEVVKKSGCEMITMALRRVDFDKKNENILDYIPKDTILLPNTSGARNADEAVRIARLAKASGCGKFIKIEVISDNKYLLPDNKETIKATKILAKEGFNVLPYMNPDLYSAKALVDAGAKAVMPLGAPIGTNKGLKTKEMIKILIQEIDKPIIVDAGIGAPSHACEAMELGADAVLVNTAIATSKDPVKMAIAFSNAIKAGRNAYLAKLGKISNKAKASSPLTNFLRKEV